MLKQRINKPFTLIIIALMVGTVIGIYVLIGRSNSSDDTNPTSKRDPSISYSPGTEQEQTEADRKKDENIDRQNRSESNTPSSGIPVIITYAAQNNDTIDVNAYTSHYAAGTCTMTFTKGGATVTKQTTATPDASTTICANPLISADEFPSKGTWQLKVTYSSNGTKGASDTQSIVIK